MGDDDKKKPQGDDFEDLFLGAVIDGTKDGEDAYDDTDLEASSVEIKVETPAEGEVDFGEFAEIDVYDGAEAEVVLEGMAEGLEFKEEAKEEAAEDEVVIEGYPGAGEAAPGFVALEIEETEWRDLVASLRKDLENQKDDMAAASLLAEMGRITERRLRDHSAANSLYEEALQRDPTCLFAMQGRRRIHVRTGSWDDVREDLNQERSLAQDQTIARRIDGLQIDLRLWQDGESGAVADFSDLRASEPQNPYIILMGLFDAFDRRDVERAAREFGHLSGLSQDKIFKSSLKSMAALLYEVAGSKDKAETMYEEVRLEAGAGFDRAVDMALWRFRALKDQWSEAESLANTPFDETDSILMRGHRFLLAAQQLFILNKVEEAASLLRLLPQSTSSLFLQFFAALAGGGENEEKIEIIEKFEEKIQGPPPLKAALQWMLAEVCTVKEKALPWYRKCIDSDRALLIPEIELAEMLTAKGDEDYLSLLESVLEPYLTDSQKFWAAAHVGLRLFENGREKSGGEIIRRYVQESRDENLIWLMNILYLARSRIDSWVDFLGKWSFALNDPDALLGVRLLQADVSEYLAGRKDQAENIRKNLITDGAQTVLPFHSLAFHPDHVQDSILFNRDNIMEYISMEGGKELIPAVMSILYRGVISDLEQRVELYRKILEIKPAHLPAFCCVRRELLSQGRFEEYFEILNDFINASKDLGKGLLGSDRMTLLWLSKRALIDEKDLRSYLGELKDDPFVSVYLTSIDTFPRIAAEAIQAIASQIPAASSQKWWFDAARKWAGVDRESMLGCLEHLDEESWKRLGRGLMETDAWVRQDWSAITDRLIEKIRSQEEGTDQVPVLSRMAYVDMFLKEEASIGLAEIQSMVQGETLPPLNGMRMLLKHLVAQNRREEILPVLLSMSKAVLGSDESRVWSWLAYRYGRDDPATVEQIYGRLLGETEKLEGDLPLLLLKEGLAATANDSAELAKILEALAISIEGDREKGSLLWLLTIFLSERDPESALNVAKEACDKIPRNPGSAFLTEKIATFREDWSSAAMGAKLAGGLFREPEHAAAELLRAAELYRDKVGETGWALQAFEQVLSLDPKNVSAFEGLRLHYSKTAAWERLGSLIETRLGLVEDETEKIILRYALAETYENAGRLADAVHMINMIADENPEDAEALQRLSDLAFKAEDWEHAASALQQLLSLNIPNDLKVKNFMRLGDIYLEQLPDPERAIFCYEKVNEFGPVDLEVAEKLVSLYHKTMAWEKGLQQAQLLYENTDDQVQQMRWLLMAGRFFEEGAKDLRRAEKVYETARGLVPMSHEPIVHMVRLYKKKNDTMALNFMLQRSMGDIKVFMQKNPDDMTLYHTVMHILSEGGDSTSARLAGTLLAGFNELLPDETLLLKNLGGPIGWSGGPWVSKDELEEHLISPSMTPAFRELILRMEEPLSKSIPVDTSRFGISRGTRLSKKHPADEQLLDQVAAWFGVRKPQVHVVQVLPNMLGVLVGSPPHVVIGEPMYEQMSTLQKVFVFAWGCKLIRSGMLPLLSVPEGELPALWVALIQQFETSYYLSGVSPEATGTIGYNLKKNLSKKLREELFGIALECSSDTTINVGTPYTEIASYGDKAGLLACGNIIEAIKLHWMLHAGAQAPLTSGSQIQDVLSESPVMAKLCEFIATGPLAKCLAFFESGT